MTLFRDGVFGVEMHVPRPFSHGVHWLTPLSRVKVGWCLARTGRSL